MRTFPIIFGQRDYSDQLGTQVGSSIANEGCFLTVDAMIAQYFGHNVTPPQLNQIFINDKIYVSGDLLPDNGLHSAYADCQYVQTFDYAKVPADLQKLADLCTDNTIVPILEIDFDHNPNDGIQTHFVAVKDCTKQADGSFLIYIYDPWYKSCDQFSLHYGTDPKTTILKIVEYKGVPMTTPTSPSPAAGANMYKGLDLNNPDSMKVCVDVFTDVQTGVYVKKADADTACSAKIGAVQKDLDTANETIKIYQNNQNQILNLLGLKTTDGQPEIVGAINGILAQEDAFTQANEKVLQMQDQIKQDALDKQKAVDDLEKQITDLETKQQQDLDALATQQADEIATVKAQCSNLGTQISSTLSSKQTISIIQKILNFVQSFKK